jgi:HlyD family secretion protein
MAHRTLWAGLAAAIVAAGALTAWWLRAPSVAAITLQPTTLVRTLQCSARVATASRVDVGSTLTGRVLDVAVVEGAPVKQGDVLLNLQSDELHAAWMQAQANERQAAARLAGLRSSGRSSAQAALSQTDSVLIAAQADMQRTRVLVDQGFLSAARLDEVQRSVAVATAQQAGALALRAATADQGTDTQQAQAQLSLATAGTAAALARLNQAVLTAPADAHVLARLVEPGQIVQPGRALLTLALKGATLLVAQADERYLEQLQVGQNAMVVADAFPGQRFAARVLSIAPLVDAQRGAVEVKFSLPQPAPAFLREDMTLSVEVETARRDAALAVPTGALRSEPGSTTTVVWIERGGRVEPRTVRLGLRTLGAAEVLEGLAAGDTVLTGPSPTPGHGVRADVTTVVAAAAKPPREDAGAAMGNAMGR